MENEMSKNAKMSRRLIFLGVLVTSQSVSLEDSQDFNRALMLSLKNMVAYVSSVVESKMGEAKKC